MNDVLSTVIPQIITAAVTLVTAFLGFRWAGINDRRRDERTGERERLVRQEDAHAKAEEDRHRFQLETLMALQEDVQALARSTSKSLHFDWMQAREGLGGTLLPEGESDENLAIRVRLGLHLSRVLDDDLRVTIEAMTNQTARIELDSPFQTRELTGPLLEAKGHELLARLSNIVLPAMRAVGEAVRKEMAWRPKGEP